MIKVHSEVKGLSFTAMKGMMLHEAQEHDLPVLADSDQTLRIESEFGEFGITDLTANEIRIDVASATDDRLYALRDSLVEHIAYYLPAVAEGITWSDAIPVNEPAPNFQIARVISSEQISRMFTRVLLRVNKPELFDDRSIHFRFLFPKDDTITPEWPTLAPNGSTKWPRGPKELHRPVYTIRKMDGAVASVDIFHHENGHTWGWARNVNPGDSVAIIGPGGNGVLNKAEVLLAADETAYPATARMIEALPDDHQARVILVSHTGDTDYPMPERLGTTIEWTTPDAFSDQILACVAEDEPAFLWVGAETRQISILRESPLIAAMDKTRKRLAVYWTRGNQDIG